jgi:PTH1 family peptidyl-tRNA hydrolase
MKYLIAGLGNIGPEYELTRHNIGFLTLDRMADEKGAAFELSRLAYMCHVKHKGRQIYLIKPTTYMNLSGKAIKYWLNELKIQVENLLVVVDDIALPFGTLRMREKGSSAGHNGLGNIEMILGTNTYPRLRMGIGDDFSKGRQVDYVLSPFSKKEIDELPFIMDKAIEGILSFCTIGAHQTMMKVNKKSTTDE